MFKSYRQSSVEFSDEENKVMEIIEARNNIMVIDLQSRTAEQNKELKEYMNKLNTEYKEAFTGLLKKSRNIENEVTVIKVLKGRKKSWR